jgi:hypothetical protein
MGCNGNPYSKADGSDRPEHEPLCFPHDCCGRNLRQRIYLAGARSGQIAAVARPTPIPIETSMNR